MTDSKQESTRKATFRIIGLKFWLGVTDNGWFNFLSRAGVDEVNFWQPSGKAPFVGLEPGAPFLFKLKRPFNHVAGGGSFVKFSTLPLSMAWDVFGIENGASSQTEFENMIRRLKRDSGARDPEIGCTVLTEPFFWPRERWIDAPMGWSANIVTGKYYDTSEGDGSSLWAAVEARRAGILVRDIPPHRIQEPTPRYGTAAWVLPRLGQGAFKVVVTDAYGRRCAVTGESTLPVLEAAHIRPFMENGPNLITNGILLRSDFHRLFDTGLITVTSDLRLEVSSRIQEQWFNGKTYYKLHGKPLANLPENPVNRPDAAFLLWHNENRYQG